MELFPLLQESEYSKSEAQDHAEKVDQLLGFEVERIEALIAEDESLSPFKSEHSFIPEYWRGLPVKALQTPYFELRTLLHHLQPLPGERIVDLGCGYARMALVLGTHYPGVQFIGYEFIGPRLKEAERILSQKGLGGYQLIHADLSAPDMRLAPAEFYFLYDFGSRKAIEKTLQDLRIIAQGQTITVIARGRSSRDQIERNHPWLAEVYSPEHFREFSIYFSGATRLTAAQSE